MENIGQVPHNDGSLSTFSGSATTLYGAEEVRFPFRLNIPILANADPTAGFVAFTIPIDANLQDSFFTAFEYFSFEKLALDMQCTAPLGTASGAVQVAFFSDPLNAAVPDDLGAAKSKLGSTDGWVMIRPRDSKSLQIPINLNPTMAPWRYVRIDEANVRMSSFGTVVGITAEPPAAGDGTVYEGWLHGWAVGRRRTENVGNDAAYYRYSDRWGFANFKWDFDRNCPVAQFNTADAVAEPSKQASFLFDRVVGTRTIVKSNDAAGNPIERTFVIDFASAQGEITTNRIGVIRLYFPEMASAGITDDGLESTIGVDLTDYLTSVACTIQYTHPNIRNQQSFNNARFRVISAPRVKWIRPAINPRRFFGSASDGAGCTISGRGDPDIAPSARPANRVPRDA